MVNLEGYINAVGRDSRVLNDRLHGEYLEQVEPGTFRRALNRAGNVVLYHNHDTERVLGNTASGSLELREDAIGLWGRAAIDDPEIEAAAKNNELRGWSFGFRILRDRWEENNGVKRRFLEEIDLSEVSLLTVTPAYIATTVEARNAQRGEDDYELLVRSEDTVELRMVFTEPTPDTGTADHTAELYRLKLRRLRLGDFAR